jgi:hypothetical protein
MTPAELWEDYRPKLAAAKEKDRHAGQLIALRAPSLVEGHWIEPLTIERFLFLEAIEHPLLNSEPCDRDDLLNFLWICSPGFEPGRPDKARKFFRRFWFKKLDNLGEPLTEHLAEEFGDVSGEEGKAPPPNWVLVLIDALANEYGWAEDAIMRMPLRRAFAYGNVIMDRRGGNRIAFSKHADKVRSEYLRELARIQKAEKAEPKGTD